MPNRLAQTLSATFLTAVLAVSTASGSVIDFFLEEEGLPVERAEGPGSVRLEGMGRLELVVEDENNELNLLDYGGNLVGIIFDKDHWSVESWSRFNDRLVDPGETTRRSLAYGNAGLDIVYRKAGQRAIGGSMLWRRLRVSRPFGDTYEARGPTGRVFYSERPFSAIAAAVSLGNRSESEDRTSDDVFNLRHKQSRLEGQLAVAMLFGDLQLGGTWNFQRGEIEGKSRDPAAFHTDIFAWHRPIDTFGGQAIYKFSESIQGGAFIQRQSFDGGESVEISWSDRFPDNGSQENFQLETTSFAEEEERTSFGTRWLVKTRQGWNLGASVTGFSGSSVVREGLNFKGTRRSQDIERDWIRLGAGAGGGFLSDRVRLGIEGYLQRGDETDRGLREMSDRSWEEYSLRVGAELFWSQDLVVRGGLIAQEQDLDVDLPATRQRGFLYTFGASFVPRGGLWQLDGSLNVDRRNRAVEGSDEKVLEEVSWGLAVRYIL
jgi:hypothetical protein